MRRRITGTRAGILCSVLVMATFVGCQLTSLTGRDSPDTKNYLSYALRLSGESRASATARAIDYTCVDEAAQRSARECVRKLTASAAYWTRHGNTSGMTGPFLNTRFMSIYEARPGYPLLLVPFIAVFGLVLGVWLAGVAVALAGSLFVLATLRAAGAGGAAALCGQVLYLTLPTGTVAMLPMADGLTLACTSAVALGCTLVLDGKRRTAGALLVTCGLSVAFLARYSQALLLAGALAAAFAGLACHRKRRGRPHRPALGLFVLCGGLAAAMQLTTYVLGWPSGHDSAQDLLTHHYQHPDVPDPWPAFLTAERVFWSAWVDHQLREPLLLITLTLAACATLRRPTCLGLLAAATAAGGVLNQAGHPNLDMLAGQRLIVLVWFLPVLAIPQLLTPRIGSGSPDETAPAPGTNPRGRGRQPTATAATALPRLHH
ncbi:hypothetical protein [Streptomyces fulvorobeus]|uniref:4-amino-4-deoxy-L-arabinose transferase-like glycosyltransferase n=1 Tax=Streptomyces fulvorobeus TaxID=284028 RepID=A0A7J0C895_9ACTN|nr:hypothetical protein [Streptomyces fulvorobeus]NYE42199.1 4-amino-4-deoxy-L-arabinose transferase-like glycosyltransferase [Streptomyces fulvorobeus]GFM98578.1 hypothetical protein Sfulv_33890 [Streptomyces fulvorobeus]